MMDQSLFKGTLNQKKMEITWNLYYANASLPLVGRPCQKIQQRNALLPPQLKSKLQPDDDLGLLAGKKGAGNVLRFTASPFPTISN